MYQYMERKTVAKSRFNEPIECHPRISASKELERCAEIPSVECLQRVEVSAGDVLLPDDRTEKHRVET
jgi:hypothetical protein